jgi:hypothetical protein
MAPMSGGRSEAALVPYPLNLVVTERPMDLTLLLADFFTATMGEEGVEVGLYRLDLMHMERDSDSHKICSVLRSEGMKEITWNEIRYADEAIEKKPES